LEELFQDDNTHIPLARVVIDEDPESSAINHHSDDDNNDMLI
jgi:hypothetical protein